MDEETTGRPAVAAEGAHRASPTPGAGAAEAGRHASLAVGAGEAAARGRATPAAPADRAAGGGRTHWLDDPGDDQVRLGGLSDALFAIVLTLLVLELRIPEFPAEPTRAQLLAWLVEQWPRMFSYFLTFLVTGAYWLAHHRMLSDIVRHDRRLLWLNLMFLLGVGLLPFPTALLGSYPTGFSWILYALTMIVIGLVLTALWGYAAAEGMLAPEVEPSYGRYVLHRGLITPGAFVLSLALLPLVGTLAFMTPLVIVPAQALHRARVLRAEPGSSGRAAITRAGNVWRIVGLTPVALFVAWSLWVAFVYHPPVP